MPTLMSIPNMILGEILSFLDFDTKFDLQFVCRTFRALLLPSIYNRMHYYEVYRVNQFNTTNNCYDYVLNDWVDLYGHYVETFSGLIYPEFYEFSDKFRNLSGLGVSRGTHSTEAFDLLPTIPIRLKKFKLNLNCEDLLTSININKQVESVTGLELTIISDNILVSNTINLMNLPNLRVLNIYINSLRSNALVNISTAFPNLSVMELCCGRLILDGLLQASFNNLLKLIVKFPINTDLPRVLGSSTNFPKLQSLELKLGKGLGKPTFDYSFNQRFPELQYLKVRTYELSLKHVRNVPNLKVVNLMPDETFDALSLQLLLSLKHLSSITLQGSIKDSIFDEVVSERSLFHLELIREPVLGIHFLTFLKANSIMRLTIVQNSSDVTSLALSTLEHCATSFMPYLKFISIPEADRSFSAWLRECTDEAFFNVSKHLRSRTLENRKHTTVI